MNIARDVERRFDSSNYELDHYLKEKIIGSMKDELVGKIMTEFDALIVKTSGY